MGNIGIAYKNKGEYDRAIEYHEKRPCIFYAQHWARTIQSEGHRCVCVCMRVWVHVCVCVCAFD